jgi:hypothetical protein
VQYGGTPCEAPSTAGCLDENASNYDATATEQAFDQYGNFFVFMLHVQTFQNTDVFMQMVLVPLVQMLISQEHSV